MAIVQGIIKLFQGARRTLQMGIRQNIPVIFALCSYCSGTTCKNLSLVHPVTLKGPETYKQCSTVMLPFYQRFMCNRNSFLEKKNLSSVSAVENE